jgi:polysaccharide export outer membrane protein
MQNVLCHVCNGPEALRRASRALALVLPLSLGPLLSGCASLGDFIDRITPRAAAAVAAPAADPGANAALPWGTPASGTLARVEDPAYRIGPEDALEVSVWKDDTLKSTAIVRPDGAISFPLVGELKVAGRTAAEVREELARRLTRFVPDAEVTVSVARVLSYRIYVIGRINKPGEFVVGRPIDVLQALTLAGGTTPFAAEDEIRIIRREGGQQTSIPFDYARLRRKGDLSQNITLRSGDVLLVP